MAPFSEEERNNHALDWSILRNGGIALYRQYQYFEEDLAWFAQHQYQVVSFACNNWSSLETMHDELAEHLSFPAYYGRNFDALDDCMTEDLIVPDPGGLAVVFRDFNRLSSTSSAHTLLNMMARAIRFHFLLGRRLVVLVQTSDPNFHADQLGGISANWNRHEWLNSARDLK